MDGEGGDGETPEGDGGDPPGGDAAGRPLRALVCAGDGSDLASALRESGRLAATAASNAAEAVATLEAGSVDVDCLVLGLDLPDGDGIEATERVRRRRPDLPVLLAAESGDEATAAAATRAGVTEYLPTTDPDAVRERVAAVAREGGRTDVIAQGSVAAALTEAYPDMVFLLDEAGRYVEVHSGDEPEDLIEGAEAPLSGDDLVGRTLHDVFPARKADGFLAAVRTAVEHREVVTGEYSLRTERGERWYESRVAPIGRAVGDRELVVVAVRDVTDRRRREQALASRRDALERTERLERLVRRVIRSIVHEETRTEIEETVCAVLTRDSPYDVAWVGEPTVRDGRTSARVRATDGEAEAVERRVDLPADGAVASAVADDEVRAVEAAGAFPSPYDGDASDPESGVVVPLCAGDVTHGYLYVGGDGTAPEGDRVATAFATLGEVVGFATTANRRRRLLSAEVAVELEFEAGSDCLLGALSAAARCSLETVTVATGDGGGAHYVEVEGTSPEALRDVGDDATGVDDARVVRGGAESGLVELSVDGRSLVHRLSELGATVRSARGVEGEARVVVELPLSADVRSLVDATTEAFPGAELVAKRDVDRPGPGAALVGPAVDRLSERQETVLRTAYHAGYYEWPRESDAEALAEALDLATSTTLYHLRRGHRGVLGALFEELDR